MPRTVSVYATLERIGGRPIELYTFRRGALTWYYTSSHAEQTVGGITYTPAAVKRGNVEQKQDTAGEQVVITLPLELNVGQALLVENSEPFYASIQRIQTSGDPIKGPLLGEMVSVKFSGDTAELTIATVEHRFKTLIPRVPVMRTCPWAVYSTQCGADKVDFAHETTVTDITGQVITVDSLTDTTTGFYYNGIVQLASGRLLFIVNHVGLELTIWSPMPAELAVDDTITVYPGCDKQFTTCETKFDNAEHFGGFPNLPDRNVTLGALR